MANNNHSIGYSNGGQSLGDTGRQAYGNSLEQRNASTHNGYMNSANNASESRYASSALTNADFLTRVEGVKKEIDSLSSNISAIASLHQRTISSIDSASTSAALESVIAQAQIIITRIRDQIKYLETDAAQSSGNTIKQTQIRNLRKQFKNRIEQYQQEEQTYKKTYQEQIARQEAMNADWGNEGVFQTAVKTPSIPLL
jgi:syntaxin 1B/2/3